MVLLELSVRIQLQHVKEHSTNISSTLWLAPFKSANCAAIFQVCIFHRVYATYSVACRLKVYFVYFVCGGARPSKQNTSDS